MQQMQVAWFNLLELSTVTVTSEASDAPAYRLYDRVFGRPWKATSTAAQTIKNNQAALGIQTDTLIIPPGHTLAGATLSWQSSNVDSGYTNLVAPWVQADSNLITKTAPCSHVYQQLVISGASVVPQIGELLFTRLVTFTAPDFGSRVGSRPEVSRVQLRGGSPAYVKWGTTKKALTYEIPSGRASERFQYDSWFDAWDGCKPFFIIDHLGNAFFAELMDPPEYVEKDVNSYALSLRIQQVF
jgi:hypothetical protein